ncbi:MAG: type II toxin-antitoxin system HicB family antitoxin [bacterium]|nr:type II toxin-antitoxin system HicB family antitoxin [bacterium]
MTQVFSASLWQEGAWFVAQCLEVDVASQGDTQEEAIANLQEALELYFESPRPMTKPVIRQVEVELHAAA